MHQAIRNYIKDEEGHWVAELDCGHGQHVRHNPPFTQRPWVTSAAGRASKLGQMLNCERCERQAAPRSVLDFWYATDIRKQWFHATPQLDDAIKTKFQSIWHQASEGALEEWTATPNGCLALVIVLDQFPLNMFRGQSKSFTTEAHAINIAKTAIQREFDKEIPIDRLSFLYMPLMHSEVLADQQQAVALYAQAGLTQNQHFAEHHYEIIKRFGRFPHRNSILDRPSTPEEIKWLASKEGFLG